MSIAFSKTGRKLRDGVIPAGTTVWKKARGHEIIELIVLEDGIIPTINRKQVQAKTRKIAADKTKAAWEAGCTAHFRKCRVPKVYVKSITDRDENSTYLARSDFNSNFVYTVGNVVTSDYDNNADVVCTEGIHVFLTREEAVAYSWS